MVVYSSTNKVYGKMEDLTVIESSGRYAYAQNLDGIPETRPLDFYSPYGCSKGTGDQYVIDYARIYGLKTVVFRQSCLAADQEVITPFGKKPISALRSGELVHSGQGWTRVRRVWQTGVKPVRRLTTMNGLSVALTEDHRVLRPHGLFSNRDFAYGDFLAVLPEARYMPRWEPIPDQVLDPETYLAAVRARTTDRRCLNEAAVIADRLLPLRGDLLLAIAELAGRLFGDGHLGIHQRQSRETPAYTVQHFGSEAELAEVSQMLRWLGLPVSGIIRWDAVSELPNGHIIEGQSCRIQQQSIPVFTLFEMLGVPVGDKVRVHYELPEWVARGHALVKRAFLRGFLGAELCRVHADSYVAPSFAQSKDTTCLENGRRWMQQLRDLLAEFGIETSYSEAEPVQYKRGTTVQMTVRLLGGRDMVPKLAAIGYGLSVERTTHLNALLRWQWTHTTPDWFEQTYQLYRADGQLFWDSLATIEPLGEQPVYDLEVEAETHLFVAGGIQVSNCIYGPRQFGVEDQGWVAWFAIRAMQNLPVTIYGDGKQVRDVLYISDLIAAFDKAIEQIDKTTGQAYNIGGGPKNTLSLLELIDLLDQHFGHRLEYSFDEWRPGDQFVFISNIQKAKADFGWEPRVSPAEGVGKLLDWLRKNEHLFAK
jgi:nucleoside-diphosphate-sugar epimerase